MITPESKYIKAVNSALETWHDLIEFCIHSEFYQKCLENQYNKKLSAKMTLVYAYLLTFPYHDRIRLESDPEYFYQYASSFVRELAPFKFSKNGYDKKGRAIFLKKIKSVLKALKRNQEDPLNVDRYIFLEQIIRLFSREEQFCEAYDLYKNFIFRFRPKLIEKYDYQI